MRWTDLKAHLLAAGSARLTGEPADRYIARSTAGPGAGGSGAIFFASGSHRVKFTLNPAGTIEITHKGNGVADLNYESTIVSGRLLEPGLHCPEQAFITVTESCIFRCRYCSVPRLSGRRKTIEEIMAMVESALPRIKSIAITSGVSGSIEEEEAYVLDVVQHLAVFGLPIGVSIYPTDQTPDRLRALGVVEVKFNIEAATPALFKEYCPGLDYDRLWRVLDRSVELFGKGRVFANVIIGLGETDEEMEACIKKLTSHGVIPVLRPLNPVAELSGWKRPSAERLKKLYVVHGRALAAAGLDTGQALTMCTNCTGCDLVPGRDA